MAKLSLMEVREGYAKMFERPIEEDDLTAFFEMCGIFQDG